MLRFPLGQEQGGFTMLQPLNYVGKLIQVTQDEFEKFHQLDENEEPLRSRIDDRLHSTSENARG